MVFINPNRLSFKSFRSLRDDKTDATVVHDPPNPILLYTFSVMTACSILCYLFVIYHFCRNPTIRQALNNHAVFLMLIVYGLQAVLNTPLHLDAFRIGYFWPPYLGYCFLIYMADYVIYEIALLLMVWASIERHILIFHPTLFNTRTKRLIGHYGPMVFAFVYPTVYYTYFILFYPCDSYYDITTYHCFAACFLWTSNAMAYYELITNGFVPVCLTAVFSMALLLRVLWKKKQMGRQMTWRKNRKMTVQLLGISVTFLAFNLGYFIIALIQFVRDPNFAAAMMVWFVSINLCAPQLVFPFLCIGTIPDLKRKLLALVPCLAQRITVAPLQTATLPRSSLINGIKGPMNMQTDF